MSEMLGLHVHDDDGASTPADRGAAGPFSWLDGLRRSFIYSESWDRLKPEGFATARRLEIRVPEAVKDQLGGGKDVGMVFGTAGWRELQSGRLVPLNVRVFRGR